jgi:hypothetical protein
MPTGRCAQFSAAQYPGLVDAKLKMRTRQAPMEHLRAASALLEQASLSDDFQVCVLLVSDAVRSIGKGADLSRLAVTQPPIVRTLDQLVELERKVLGSDRILCAVCDSSTLWPTAEADLTEYTLDLHHRRNASDGPASVAARARVSELLDPESVDP